MSNDTRLQSLQKDLENLQRAQTAITEDIRTLRRTMEAKIERLRTEYGNDILSLERKYDANTKRIPDVNRQIDTRQRELERERERSSSTGPSSDKKSSWL